MFVEEMIINENKQMSIFHASTMRSIFTWNEIVNNK